MGYIKTQINMPREAVLKMLSDDSRVNEGVSFDEKIGTPRMILREKKNRIKITCQLMNKGRRDNGFLVGTYFTGKLSEKDGVTTLSGFIFTAPVYHLILLGFIAFFIFQCIKYQGLSVVPIFAVLFDIFLFRDEFKKRGLIKRYIHRAFRRLYNEGRH